MPDSNIHSELHFSRSDSKLSFLEYETCLPVYNSPSSGVELDEDGDIYGRVKKQFIW
jgi:hypothetical protein